MKKTLAELRDEKDLSQVELAKLAECSPSSIAMYETGERTPTLNRAKSIAKIFGVRVEDIIFGPRTHGTRAKSPKPKSA